MTRTTIVITIISVITALLSCFTALMTYRREKLKNRIEATRPPDLKLLKYRQKLPTPQAVTGQKPLMIVLTPFALGILAVSLWMLYDAPSIFTVINVAFWALCLVSYVFQIRILSRGPGADLSPVRREIQVIIDGDYDAVFDRCENALRGIRAAIISSDRDLGLIHADLAKTWRSFGERIEVTVLRSEHANCMVTLVSDSVSPALLDFGKNSQNLKDLIKHL